MLSACTIALRRFLNSATIASTLSCGPSSAARPARCVKLAVQDVADFLLSDAGVACLNGTAFGQHGDGFLRFSYANSLANIMEAIDRIKKVSGKWA